MKMTIDITDTIANPRFADSVLNAVVFAFVPTLS